MSLRHLIAYVFNRVLHVGQCNCNADEDKI